MMEHLVNPNEISRESLVKILEIMHRLAAPAAMPELLREIIEVGKVAIVAEAGVLWLLERSSNELLQVTPPSDNSAAQWKLASKGRIAINIPQNPTRMASQRHLPTRSPNMVPESRQTMIGTEKNIVEVRVSGMYLSAIKLATVAPRIMAPRNTTSPRCGVLKTSRI